MQQLTLPKYMVYADCNKMFVLATEMLLYDDGIYLERLDDGTLLYHCHSCMRGPSGY